jgi:hypothetical protein
MACTQSAIWDGRAAHADVRICRPSLAWAVGLKSVRMPNACERSQEFENVNFQDSLLQRTTKLTSGGALITNNDD